MPEMTNADALLRLMRDNLVDVIANNENLRNLVCDAWDAPEGAVACPGDCRACFRGWADAPYSGGIYYDRETGEFLDRDPTAEIGGEK